MAQWLFPAAVVGLQLVLKLVVGRDIGLPDCIEAVLAAPVDAAFLGLSLLAALIIIDNADVDTGIGLFTTGIIAAVLVVYLWRRSQKSFDEDKVWTATALGVANWAATAIGLIYVVQLLESGALP